MNNINITVNLSEEDRARLDKSITLQEQIYALLLNRFNAPALTAEDDALRKKLEQVVASVAPTAAEPAEPAETPQDEAEAPTATDTPAEPEAPATAEPAPQEAVKYTLADIQAKVIALVQAGKKAEVRAICVSYAPQVTQIPAEKFGEVMAKLAALEG